MFYRASYIRIYPYAVINQSLGSGRTMVAVLLSSFIFKESQLGWTKSHSVVPNVHGILTTLNFKN